MKRLLSTILLISFGLAGNAQCPAGEIEVSVVVSSDNFGYEGYWQLVPAGNNCGTGTIGDGGNAAVGCFGGGAQAQTPGGYANNQQFIEGPYCLTIGGQYDLHYVDDWGDGGFNFAIMINGYEIETYTGVGAGGVFTFTAQEPHAYDMLVTSSSIFPYVNTGSFDLEAQVQNNGTTLITSYDLNYAINGGAPFTHSVTGTSLIFGASETVTHNIPVAISSNGIYSITIWADNLNNGNMDADSSNDTLVKQVEAGPGTPNMIDDYLGAMTSVNQIAGAGDLVNSPTDLDFHPTLSNMELWVCNKGTENSGGSTVTIYDAGEPSQTTQYKQDGNAWHFMSLPTGIAFSENGNWANSPGVYDANHNGGAAFTGPSLWSSDMTIYAEPSGGNGSHLDMLHASPYAQGIAAEIENVFWVFDGFSKDIVRYDFAEDHGPGNSFHGDAIIRRYSEDEVLRDPTGTVVSHLVLDENKQWLYTVDHGNQRVIRIDITTGTNMGVTPLYTSNEPVVEYSAISGYTQETVITGLDKPAGIDVIDDRLIVSEHLTGEIIIYDISAMPAIELGRIQTGYSSVQGIKIGPDGQIWFVDQNSDGVYNLEVTSLAKVNEPQIGFSVYPNPNANGKVFVYSTQPTEAVVEVRNTQGQLISSTQMSGHKAFIDIEDQASGVYVISILNEGTAIKTEKLILK